MEFTFDATKLNGEQVVLFEEVYLEEKLVAVHADLKFSGICIRDQLFLCGHFFSILKNCLVKIMKTGC